MNIEDFIIYLDKRIGYSKLTAQSYASDLYQFEKFLITDNEDVVPKENQEQLSNKDNNFTVEDKKIDVKTIRAWILTLSDKGISARSINRKITALRTYFRWVEKNDNTFSSPMIKIIMQRMSKRNPSFIRDDDMKYLLKESYIEDNFLQLRNHVIIELLFATGIRQAEMLSLRKDSFSFENKYIRVLGKRNKERIVPIGNKLIEDLIKYISFKQRLGIEEQLFWVDEQGKPMTKNQLYYLVHKKLSNYNVGERSPHVFRHTCATDLMKNGADIVDVKNLLGHTSLTATEVYTHATIEELKKEYKRSFEHKINK